MSIDYIKERCAEYLSLEKKASASVSQAISEKEWWKRAAEATAPAKSEPSKKEFHLTTHEEADFSEYLEYEIFYDRTEVSAGVFCVTTEDLRYYHSSAMKDAISEVLNVDVAHIRIIQMSGGKIFADISYAGTDGPYIRHRIEKNNNELSTQLANACWGIGYGFGL